MYRGVRMLMMTGRLIVVAGLVGGDLSESGETRWELLS